MENISVTGRIIYSINHIDGTITGPFENHNIIVNQGDWYMADLLCNSPIRQKIDSTHGYIAVGTGWTGSNIKSNSWVNTQVGTPQIMNSGYPKLKGSWGTDDGRIVQFNVTYPIGSLNATDINEIAIVSSTLPGTLTSCLAYAQLVPSADVSSSDVLNLLWEIRIYGQ